MDGDTVMGGTAPASTTAADTSEADKAEADRLAAVANIIATAQAAASKVMTDQQAADLALKEQAHADQEAADKATADAASSQVPEAARQAELVRLRKQLADLEAMQPTLRAPLSPPTHEQLVEAHREAELKAAANEADPFARLWATHMKLALAQSQAQLDADKAAGRVPVTAPGAGPSSGAGPSYSIVASQVSRKLPMPAQWTGSNGDNKLPRGRIWLDLVVSYCALVGWSFTDVFSFFLAGTAAEWFVNFKQSLAHSRQVLTLAVISQEFLDFYDPSHRDEAKEAREKLLRKECTMIQHPTVKVYEQQFKILIRQAVDMPATDQIAWFLHGLSPTIKHLCIVDHAGKDWRNLPALIDFALGAELRHQAQTDSSKFVG